MTNPDVWLRSKENGRIEPDVLGPVNWRHAPKSPYYEFKPGWWMNARAWMEPDDKHVHVAHDCRGIRESHTLPWPVWQALPDGRLDPSYSCDRCGLHTFLTVAWEAVNLDGNSDPREATDD